MSRTSSGDTCSTFCFASSIRSWRFLKVIGSARERSNVECASICIERRHRAKRDRPLLGDVSDWDAGDARYLELAHDLTKHLVQGATTPTCIFRTFHALAERDSLTAAQHSRQLELLKHAVDAINGLVDVLEHQDRVGEIRRVLRAAQRHEHRQIPAGESALGFATAKYTCVFGGTA